MLDPLICLEAINIHYNPITLNKSNIIQMLDVGSIIKDSTSQHPTLNPVITHSPHKKINMIFLSHDSSVLVPWISWTIEIIKCIMQSGAPKIAKLVYTYNN